MVFLDVDDTLLDPPYQAMKRFSRIIGKAGLPSLTEVRHRQHVELYEAFPRFFRSRKEMWKMALGSIPFGLVKSQEVCEGIDQEGFSKVLKDDRVILLSKHPPFLARHRIKHIKRKFGIDVGDRYLPCGPISGKCPDKIAIIRAIAELNDISLDDCLLIDDHPGHIVQAEAVGIRGQLVDTNWNKGVDTVQRVPREQIHESITIFLGSTDATLWHPNNKTIFDWRDRNYKKQIFTNLKSLVRVRTSKIFSDLCPDLLTYKYLSLKTPWGFNLPVATARLVSLNKLRTVLNSLSPERPFRCEKFSTKFLRTHCSHIEGFDTKIAGRYAKEIVNGRSHRRTVIAHKLLKIIQALVFRNVNVRTQVDLRRLMQSHFVLFVPHHRSIYDSALLVKTVFELAGTMPMTPAALKMKSNFIGAGGRLFGSFFIRRQRVDPTYTAVLSKLIRFVLETTPCAAIFVEGQRSRRGLPLPPKSGIFKQFLTQAASVKGVRIAVVPVSFTYNQLPEAQHLLKEIVDEHSVEHGLSAKTQADMFIRKYKIRSGFWPVAKRFFKRRTASAYVTFGSPIILSEIPADPSDLSVATLQATMSKINEVVPPLPSSVASLAVLAQDQQHLSATKLLRFLNLSNSIITLYPEVKWKGLAGNSSRDLFDELNSLPFLNSKFRDRGIKQTDFICVTDLDSHLASHYANNVIHYFALPSLFAFLLKRNKTSTRRELAGEFERCAKVVAARFFVGTDTDLRTMFDKICNLFAVMQLMRVDPAGKFNSFETIDESPFLLLANIGAMIAKESNLDFSDRHHRIQNRLAISVPVTLYLNQKLENAISGRIINLSNTGGAIRTTHHLESAAKITIVFDQESTDGQKTVEIVRQFSGGFGFRFLDANSQENETDQATVLPIAS